MDISFVRTAEKDDRVYACRTDHTEISWAFPSYGNYIPHDLVHLVVETAFGLKNGFWGKVDAGLDVARIHEIANRAGGSNKYAAFGADQFDLHTAELLAAQRWSDMAVPDREITATIIRSFPHLAPVTDEKIASVRETIDRLCLAWIDLLPKGTLRACFDVNNLQQSFDTLGNF